MHVITQTQFFDQSEHVLVTGEPVMVEMLHGPVPVGFLETGRQTAGVVGCFKNGDFVSFADQITGGSHAAKTSANDSNLHAGFSSVSVSRYSVDPHLSPSRAK